MTLSEDEQNSLDRIENSLAAEDPDFANRLDASPCNVRCGAGSCYGFSMLVWSTLTLVRRRYLADLEDPAFRLYLSMARTLAHIVDGETDADRVAAEQAAELGPAYAVLAWRQRTCGGFRRFAWSTIMRQLLTP